MPLPSPPPLPSPSRIPVDPPTLAFSVTGDLAGRGRRVRIAHGFRGTTSGTVVALD
jgi:hypothetical protein